MKALATACVLLSFPWSAGCKKDRPPSNADLEARATTPSPNVSPSPSPHPPMPQMPMRPRPGGPEVTYTVPTGWTSHPPRSAMRRAQFVLPGAGDQAAAELVVFHFPGTGGSVDDNLQRWYTQFKQPDGSETAKKAEARDVEVGPLKVRTVYVAGTYLKPKNPMAMAGPTEDVKDQALLAAVVPTPAGPWFFKAVGPRATIDAQRPSFDAFVKSFQLRQGG